MANITFYGTVKDKVTNGDISGAIASISITKPTSSIDIITTPVQNGIFSIVKEYGVGHYSASLVVTMSGYNDSTVIVKPFDVALINGDMVVTFNVDVA
jgi:hypothetical protein